MSQSESRQFRYTAIGIDFMVAPLFLKHSPTAWIATPKAGPISPWLQVVFFTNSLCDGISRISTAVVI
jgi:hypothetical protein